MKIRNRGTHNLSHHHLTTCDMGYLIPVSLMEVLPGDTFKGNSSALVRVAPLATPLMHPVDIRVHAFYVPNRIVYDDWEDFITEEQDLTLPTVTVDDADKIDFMRRLGCACASGDTANALPVRVYNKIYNEWFRDKDLITARAEDTMSLARIAWGKDYFSTARPQAVVGDSLDVNFSFTGTDIEVQGLYRNDTRDAETSTKDMDSVRVNAGTDPGNIGDRYVRLTARQPTLTTPTAAQDTDDINIPFVSGTDLSAAGGIDIDDLRRALALQRFNEARARFGSDYASMLRYYGINPRDGRLQRPEPVMSSKATISFSEVLATAEGTNTAVGDIFGHGLSALRTRGYRKTFEEHGYFMILASVRPMAMYADQRQRTFTRSDSFDFYHPELEVEAWQAVNQKEIYGVGASNDLFGYVPKYDDYRHHPSYVSGEFAGTTYDDWHLARKLGASPTLNQSFVECAPSDRAFQDTGMPEILINFNHRIRATRMVSQKSAIGRMVI